MKRRLWLINVVLAVALVLLGNTLWQHWQETKAHEQSVLLKRTPLVAPPPVSPRPMVAKLQPTTYVEVAQKVLFSKDRNPDVIPPPPVPPPPPPPIPPFPSAHGVMIWGDVPPTIILSMGKGEQQAYRAGDKVGEFEIASITDQQIVLTWDDKTFVKNISDLEAEAAEPAEKKARNAAPLPPGPPAPVQTVAPKEGPGDPVTPDGRTRMCDSNDPSPMGAVVDGYRKIPMLNPMAPNAHFCRWQAVN